MRCYASLHLLQMMCIIAKLAITSMAASAAVLSTCATPMAGLPAVHSGRCRLLREAAVGPGSQAAVHGRLELEPASQQAKTAVGPGAVHAAARSQAWRCRSAHIIAARQDSPGCTCTME